MSDLDHVPSGFISRIVFLFLYFLSALFYMQSVLTFFDSLLRRLSGVPFIGAQGAGQFLVGRLQFRQAPFPTD